MDAFLLRGWVANLLLLLLAYLTIKYVRERFTTGVDVNC